MGTSVRLLQSRIDFSIATHPSVTPSERATSLSSSGSNPQAR